MNEINYKDYYLNNKFLKQKKKLEWNNYFFGVIFGITLIFLGSINLLLTLWPAKRDYIFMAIIIFGIINIILAIIYPNAISPIKKVMSYFANKLGEVVFSIILSIIYILLIIPVGFFVKRKEKRISTKTTFVNYEYENNYINISKNSIIYRILRIFKFFINQKNYIFIPLLIVLIILSIVIVFAQSSVVAPFIYTLF